MDPSTGSSNRGRQNVARTKRYRSYGAAPQATKNGHKTRQGERAARQGSVTAKAWSGYLIVLSHPARSVKTQDGRGHDD